jgi:hypothetical protein
MKSISVVQIRPIDVMPHTVPSGQPLSTQDCPSSARGRSAVHVTLASDALEQEQ